MSTPVPVLLDELVDLIDEAGLRVTIDPRNVNPPAVWISPRQITHDILAGGGTLTVDLWLIAPDNGTPAAMKILSEMLTAVLSVVDPDAPTSLAESLALPDTPAPLPAWRVTTELETC